MMHILYSFACILCHWKLFCIPIMRGIMLHIYHGNAHIVRNNVEWLIFPRNNFP